MNKKELNKIAKEYEGRLTQYVLDDIKNMKQIIRVYKHSSIPKTAQILNEIGINTETISKHEFLAGLKVQEMLSLRRVLTTIVSQGQEYINFINELVGEYDEISSNDITTNTKGHKK